MQKQLLHSNAHITDCRVSCKGTKKGNHSKRLAVSKKQGAIINVNN